MADVPAQLIIQVACGSREMRRIDRLRGPYRLLLIDRLCSRLWERHARRAANYARN